MTQKVDYVAALTRAISQLDDDARGSYAARGAVYDRYRAELLVQIAGANPPYTAAAAAAEEVALRDAIRRVENDLVSDGAPKLGAAPSVQVDAAGSAAPPISISKDLNEVRPDKARALTSAANGDRRKTRRPIFWRVAWRVIIGALLLGVGIVGYAHLTGKVSLPSLADWLNNSTFVSASAPVDEKASPTPGTSVPIRAVLYEEDPAVPAGKAFAGEGVWRVRSETKSPDEKPHVVVTLDAKVPERGLSLSMSIRRETDKDAVLSHLIEVRFTTTEQMPHGKVANMLSVLMSDGEKSAGLALIGQSIKVAPGVFLFGLSGTEIDTKVNLSRLKEQSWIQIPIAFSNSQRAILTIEKGDAGKRAIDEVIKNGQASQ